VPPIRSIALTLVALSAVACERASPYRGLGALVVLPPGGSEAHARFERFVAFEDGELVARGDGVMLRGRPPLANDGEFVLGVDRGRSSARTSPETFAVGAGRRVELFQTLFEELWDRPNRPIELHAHRDDGAGRSVEWFEPSWRKGIAPPIAIVGEHLVALHATQDEVVLSTLALADLDRSPAGPKPWKSVALREGAYSGTSLADAAGRLFAYAGGTLYVVAAPPREPTVLSSWEAGDPNRHARERGLAVTPDGSRVAIGNLRDGDRRWVAVFRVGPDDELEFEHRIDSARGREEGGFGDELAFVGDVLAVTSLAQARPHESRVLFFDERGAPTSFGGLSEFRVPGYSLGFRLFADPEGDRLAIGAWLHRKGPAEASGGAGVLFLLHR
jgi:hypothetical protein